MEKPSKQSHIRNLHTLTRENLCKLLDEELGIGTNYEHLAAHVGLSQVDLDKISKSSQPTHTVLKLWGQKSSATIPELLNILNKMVREDCVEILTEDPFFANSVWRLQDLKKSILQKLRIELAAELNPSQEKFITLAGHLGYDREEVTIKSLLESECPVSALLNDYEVNGENDVFKLMKTLERNARPDLVKMLRNEAGEIFEPKSNDQKRAKKRKVDNYVFGLQGLKESTHQKLLTELAAEFNPSRKKFINFAEDLWYTRGDVNKFLKSQNPVSSLLGHYEVNGENNVFRLIETLERIGRRDLLEMLRKEEEEFFERKRTDQERAKKWKADSCGYHNDFRLEDLNKSTYQKLRTELAAELNSPLEIIINFAEDLGCARGDVNEFLTTENPVSSLLVHYEVNGENNVFQLMESLKKIKRGDLVEMLWKDVKEFFERKSKGQEMAKKRKEDSCGDAAGSVKGKKRRKWI